MNIKWSIRKKDELAFVPFRKGKVTFTENALEIDISRINYSEIVSAELVSRYLFMFPNRVLRFATKHELVTLGPIPKNEVTSIPFAYESKVVKSFWNNEFAVVGLVLLTISLFL